MKTFEIINGLLGPSPNSIFQQDVNAPLRGNKKKLTSDRSKQTSSSHFISKRIGNI